MTVEVASYYFSRTKRVFDISLAVVLLIILSPLFLFISLAILFSAGWPIFFIQKRVGKEKKPFNIIKFRTMYKNAHNDQRKYWKLNESPFPTFKLSNDPRFVGIGKWLSKTGLDELPQLLNILKGEMSFIGPRPLPIAEANKLTGSWDFRYTVKPGIISLWALSDKRFKSLDRWKRLEKDTLSISSLKQDVLIIWSAVQALLIFLLRRIS